MLFSQSTSYNDYVVDSATISTMTKVITINIQNSHLLGTGLKSLLEQRIEQHNQLKGFVALVLDDQTQPLTVAELTTLVNRELQRNLHNSTIRLIVNELVNEKRAVTRVETQSERALRAGEKPVPGTASAIYFSTAGGAHTPPMRTVAVAVTGVDLSKSTLMRKTMKRRGRPPGSKNKGSNSLPSTPDSTKTIELLIEQLVAERTRELQSKLDEANAKLASLKNLLRS